MEHYNKFSCVHILKTEFITSMALSPDGTIFACGQTDNYTFKDQSIKVFDFNRGQRICTFNIFGRAVFADFIAISPNGKHLVWRNTYEEMYIRKLYVAIRKHVATAYKAWKLYCVGIISYFPPEKTN